MRDRLGLRQVLIGVLAVVLVAAFGFAWKHNAWLMSHDDPSATGSGSPIPRPSAGPTTPSAEPSLDTGLAAQVKALQRASRFKRLRQLAQAEADRRAKSISFRMIDQNALAASMNNPGERNAAWPKYGARTTGLWSMIQGYGADIATFQEFQPVQQQLLHQLSGGQYDMFPTGNVPLATRAIMWRASRFQLVSAQLNPNPWFFGSRRLSPQVLLRDRKTGLEFYVATYHNPPDTAGSQARWRHGDMWMEINATNRLLTQQKPVIVTGDMNDRSIAFCAWTSGTGMHAASGGSNVGGDCRTPPNPVDWTFGSDQVAFSGYHLDEATKARRISDHAMVVYDVSISPN